MIVPSRSKQRRPFGAVSLSGTLAPVSDFYLAAAWCAFVALLAAFPKGLLQLLIVAAWLALLGGIGWAAFGPLGA